MFFPISKLVGLVIQPVNFLVLLGLTSLVLWLTRFARLGRALTAAVVIAFAIVAFSPLSALMLRPLEDRFPKQEAAALPVPAGIIVLGGALDSDVGDARDEASLTDAAERLTAGVELARRFPKARLVFTGGSANIRQNGIDEARIVRRLWLGLGVPASQMIFEDKSRNTFENAVMTRTLVEPKPGETWLLVTSASHMPRSVGIFRKVGWDVVPFPVDYRTFGDLRDVRPSLVAIESLRRLDTALHEWFGLLAYYLSHRTSALFPAPEPVKRQP